MSKDKKAADAISGEVATGAAGCASDKKPGIAGRARNQDVLPGILGKQLRAAYSELLNAPVPDAITQLVKELENKEPAAHPKQGDDPGGEESGQ